uniref:ATP-dependent RNA helicase RhlB n=1 Tax=Stenotrophomonas sp. UBA7606 TaxID=1947559 RepID=UPI0025DC88F3
PQKLVVETESITAERVRQRIYFPADEEKLPLLIGLLSRSEGARTMVFVNTKVFVERVARALEKAGYRVGVLSGDVPQKKRESLLNRFQKGQLEILVATDVAARGLHIDGIKYVYNYDLPFDAEDYVHRIGRTARLGEEGDAISFACERYAMSLPDIEAYIEQKIPVESVTSELLTALPRPERAPLPEGEEGESVGAIFREAREQKAADEARRGGGRSGGKPGERRGERSADGKPRGPRKPRSEGAPGNADGSPKPPRPAAEGAPNAANSPAVEGERAPRKRRRRRHGRPVEGTEAAAAVAPAVASNGPVQLQVKSMRGGNDSDSFLTRLGRKIRRMLSGS